MSTVPEQRRGDPAQLGDLPVGADAAAVALEAALARGERGVELARRLVLVLAVGEQDRVADARRASSANSSPASVSHAPDRGAAAWRASSATARLGRRARLRAATASERPVG